VRKEATVVQVKSAYSILSNAINKSVLDNGNVEDWDTNEKIFIEKYLAPYLTHVKKLAVNQRYNMGTISTQGSMKTNIYLDWSWNATNRPLYMLANGMIVTYANSNDGTKTFVIDINGADAPNQMGIDGFAFSIDNTTQSIIPAGGNLDREIILGKKGSVVRACKHDATWQYYRGGYCAALMMKDGWKITRDYPWNALRK
jgi:hypothetical protein